MRVNNEVTNLNYSVWDYILRIASIAGFSFLCFIIFQNKSTPLSSFIWSSIAFLFITVFSTIILFKNTKWVWFFVLAYVFKILIGILHYLYFIDPNYFQTGIYSPVNPEYAAVYDYIINSAHDKLTHGILYFRYHPGGVTHQEILSFISIPFMFFGDYAMTIAPINAFSSLLISMNVILLSRFKFQYSSKSVKPIALLTAYFPMTLISSLLYRDIVGLALMSVGLILVLFSKRPITQYVMLIIACYLFYLQRTVYPLILLMAFIINAVINRNYKSKGWNLFYKVATVIVSIVVVSFVFAYANIEAYHDLAARGLDFNIILFPIRMIVGLIGPFPWAQFLLYETIPAVAYQLQDYLQGALNITIFVAIIFNWRKYFKKGSLNLLNLTGVWLIITGIMTPYMHMTYIAKGFMFLIPILFAQIRLSEFRKRYLYSFLAILFLNIIVVVFFDELGLSRLWR